MTYSIDTVISAITFAAGQLTGGSYAGRTMPAGSCIRGTIASITLTSGVAQAYKL